MKESGSMRTLMARERPRGVGIWLAALVAALGIAACGGDGLEGGAGEEEVQVVPAGEPGDQLTIANWPLYIDPGNRGTIAEFEEETGISVEYNEEINDNTEFFGKVRQELEQGGSGGRDMFVVTDWMAAKMHELGYLQNLNRDALPTVQENLQPALRSPVFDPEREFSVPWQSGMTGLIVRTDQAPDVQSIEDAFDPRYRGKVTVLTELRDTVPLIMKMMGKDPETAPKEDWLEAIDFLQEQVDSGQIRRFTGNDYTRDLTKGDAWISFGWSGDAVQLQADNPNIEFVMPEEGCNLWSDNMVIPVGAPNPQGAQEFMEFVYQPEVQADIAEYVNYVTPVQGTREVLEQRDPDLTENQLIFPDEQFTANCTSVRTLEAEEEQEITQAFERVIGG